MKGVTIIALNKASYFHAAYNLAVSIRYYNPSINITLLSDGLHRVHCTELVLSAFDKIIEMERSDYEDEMGWFQPGLAKISMYRYIPYQEAIYVDADSLCLQDIGPLFNECSSKGGFIYGHVIGTGGYTDDIPYNIWGRNPYQFKFFDISEDGTLNTLNSSWLYIKKCPEAEKIFHELRTYWDKGYGLENLRSKWGDRTYPDELFFNGVLAKHGITPRIGREIMFFGNELDKRTYTELHSDYLFMTLYGNGKVTVNKKQTTVKLKYIEWYDRLCFKMFAQLGRDHHYKSGNILRGKHINK